MTVINQTQDFIGQSFGLGPHMQYVTHEGDILWTLKTKRPLAPQHHLTGEVVGRGPGRDTYFVHWTTEAGVDVTTEALGFEVARWIAGDQS